MPYDKESGKKYNSPEEALADALPEGADASEVMGKLTDMGYSLEPKTEGVGVAIEVEAETEEAPKEESAEESSEETEEGEKPSDEGAKELEISVGAETPEYMSKRRDKVANSLMEKFKKGMV